MAMRDSADIGSPWLPLATITILSRGKRDTSRASTTIPGGILM